MEQSEASKILGELEAIKKLQILELLDKGFSQNQIALTLGVAQATISRMFPKGVLKRGKRAPTNLNEIVNDG